MSCAYFEIWLRPLSHRVDFSDQRITLYRWISRFLPPMHYLCSTSDLAHALTQRPREGNYSTSHMFPRSSAIPSLGLGAKNNIRPHSMNLRIYCSHDTSCSLVWLVIVDWSITTCNILCQYISFSSPSFILIRFKGRFNGENRVRMTYTSTYPECCYTVHLFSSLLGGVYTLYTTSVVCQHCFSPSSY